MAKNATKVKYLKPHEETILFNYFIDKVVPKMPEVSDEAVEQELVRMNVEVPMELVSKENSLQKVKRKLYEFIIFKAFLKDVEDDLEFDKKFRLILERYSE